MRISDWSSDVCSSDLEGLSNACRGRAGHPDLADGAGLVTALLFGEELALHRLASAEGNVRPVICIEWREPAAFVGALIQREFGAGHLAGGVNRGISGFLRETWHRHGAQRDKGARKSVVEGTRV